MKLNIRTLMAALFTASVLLSAGCNTISGVGQDIESAGKTIDKTGQKR